MTKFNLYIRITTLLFAISLSLSHGIQAQDLSPEATSLQNKLNELKLNHSDIVVWNQYLELFPDNKDEFIKLFDSEDFSELYTDSSKFIFIFQKAPKSLSSQIINVIFNITKNGAPGCCDAWSALHRVLSEQYATNDYPVFIGLLKNLNITERRNVIKFLADKEAIRNMKSYQKIIDNLKSQNEELLAQDFEEARKQRIAEPH